MIQKHRIATNIGKDQKVTVELKQDFDVLEILSLKFTQQQIYTSMCSDYGVVCGRITANNGFGIGNARVSIFIPLLEEDENDPVISVLYPYKEVTDKNDDGYRYNLLPSRKQHGGHASTGTFPDQSDILENEAVLEVYEKYYNYTVKTNSAGDFMIWGVPIGVQTVHVDVDLSDIGCFSLRPADFKRLGIGVDNFKNNYTFKSSEDLNSLPQIISFDRSVEVYPFWGNEELCEIGITRTDFDLSERGVNIQPTAYLIGGVFTDTYKNSVNKNCIPRRKMGRKCDLVTKSANIEAIRFMPIKDEFNRPYLEFLPIDEDIPDDGGFVLPVEMNMDYVITNEFGENEITNDPNKGIPTSACYRFRFNLNDTSLERTRTNADFLVPNIREFQKVTQTGATVSQTGYTIDDSSYYFGTQYSGYPSDALSLILNNQNGEYYPQDYFYRFTYNKVYTISSFHSHFFGVDAITKGLRTTAASTVGLFGAPLDDLTTKYNFANINEITPSEEEDCGDKLTPPSNFGVKNYTFQLLIADFLMSLDYLIKWVTLQALNFIVKDILGPLAEVMISIGVVKKAGRGLRRTTSKLQINNVSKLTLVNYPECEECSSEDLVKGGNGDVSELENCIVAKIRLTGTTDNAYDRVVMLGPISGFTDTGDCVGQTPLTSREILILNQTEYVLEYNEEIIFLNPDDGGSYLYGGNVLGFKLNDRDYVFKEAIEYTVNVRRIGTFKSNPPTPTSTLETGCQIYDTLYNEKLATGYFVTSGNTRIYKPLLSPGDDVQSTLIAGSGTAIAGTNPSGPSFSGRVCRDIESEVRYLFTATPSYRSEFSNGVFYIVPGTQTSKRLSDVLLEYYKRKRVGKMFCGGIVNYGFIDNWLSGSLYFTQFKAKKFRKLADATSESVLKYCRNLARFVFDQNRFYYRSSSFKTTTGFDIKNLNRPTTIVDLGPRDEFIKEICIDKSLDPNCSVTRSIGATSYKSLGDLLGLAINYRMDVANDKGDLDMFFSNKGFQYKLGIRNVLDGDILQLLSINNEAGIEEFDLENPKYLGYRYDTLDPELNKPFFQISGSYGPLPVTMELDEDGERVRLCLNEPGRLTESSQPVPFYLWDKGGTGFGPGGDGRSNQSWNYTSLQLQPLQGMTYGYTLTGSHSDPSDKYMLLPMTKTNPGVIGSTELNLTDDVDFDVVISNSGYTEYNSEYPGFTYLYVTSGTTEQPLTGKLFVRYGNAGNDTTNPMSGATGWQSIDWTSTTDIIIPEREDYYSGNKQILSTPYQFYFGLIAGKSGMDKFIDLYGPKDAFTSED
jgi:hypothetical protein